MRLIPDEALAAVAVDTEDSQMELIVREHLAARQCPKCHKQLVPHAGEPPSNFKRRRFCSRLCAAFFSRGARQGTSQTNTAIRSRRWRARHRERDREKMNAYNATYRARHREEMAAARAEYIERGGMDAWRYKLPLGWRRAQLEAQRGLCAACGEKLMIGASVIDHDHRTGAIRSVICQFCNRALGQAFESPTRLRSLAAYLEKYASRA